jgi:site-specific DNA recombinase
MASTIRRCAIYTRKSSEEGLEQDYNSLHAQREACEAFIRSQAGEGWRLIKTAYDDGGFSGAGMERPGLQQLLVNIREGLVDTVVVYKVDRLTRSLTDFARMVELFDAKGVSFVAGSPSRARAWCPCRREHSLLCRRHVGSVSSRLCLEIAEKAPRYLCA